MTLPPGQRIVDGFPRFGTHLRHPPPTVPPEPVIEVGGIVTTPFTFRIEDLAALPRRQLTADFHCVAGWTATGLRWEGVAFETFFREIIEPRLASDERVTHVVVEGLDGYRSILLLEDAMAQDVLIADRLHDRPLEPDHGAPARLVSPLQYGFKSTKHLNRIEVHRRAPAELYHRSPRIQLGLQLVKPHQRARVWNEERHRYLPGRIVRPIYLRLVPAIRRLRARGRPRPRSSPAA